MTSLNALRGKSTNWFLGIPKPITDDNKGILNVLVATGIFWTNITPFDIWHCGTVGDINGYLTPFEKFGDIKVVNPVKTGEFAIG